MLLALAQIDPIVGAFESNFLKIKKSYEEAEKKGARVLLTPEMVLCGYPLYDFLDRPEIYRQCQESLEKLRTLTEGKSCALIVGYVIPNPLKTQRPAQNVISILENGKEILRQAKTLLPTYDIFDEARYFEPAREHQVWNCDGQKFGVAICEDLWSVDPSSGKPPALSFKKEKVDLVFSISASPFESQKQIQRENVHQKVVQTVGAPLLYVNQVGATDEVLFDGGSFALDRSGETVGRLKPFEIKTAFFDWQKGVLSSQDPLAQETEGETLSLALTNGIQSYFERTGFEKAVLGLSGGIDSAVVATLAARALGPKNVLGVAMPSQFSSSHSLEDAEILAKNLGIEFRVQPIKFFYSVMAKEISGLEGITLENLQARLRALVVLAHANQENRLVLSTGNKSELATGFCTQYGDMVGAMSPIGDLFKTKVYELAKTLNQNWENPIPERCITKPPSAELKENQKDEDRLPPYEVLDPLLEDYLEKRMSIDDLTKKHDSQLDRPGWVKAILRTIVLSEYKRRQAAPVLKVTSRAFGIGRRVPIAKQTEFLG